MTTKIVIFRLTDPKGVSFWSAFIDEVGMSGTGLEYRFSAEVGVEHTIRYTFAGQPGGSIKAEVIDHGEVVAFRDPAKIPLGATHSWDQLSFTIKGDS